MTPFSYYRMRVYGWKIWDGDTLVRDFVPCYRLFDLRAGLLDTVSGRFYDNAGTGMFNYDVTTCREQVTLPLAYHALDYLVATGTQHIATGVTAAEDVAMMAEFMSFPSSARQSFTRDHRRSLGYVNGASRPLSGDALVMGSAITFLKSGDCVQGAGRLYAAYVWQADELVRHFQPCYRVSDGVAGLYDLVTQAFYPSAGAHPFLHGTGGEVGTFWSGGSYENMGYHRGKTYGALTNFSFAVWVRNPGAGDFGSDYGNGLVDRYGALVAQGALGGFPGFCCYSFFGTNGVRSLNVQLRDSDNKVATLAFSKPDISRDGKWHHLAYTLDYTAGQAHLYLDGVAVTSRTSQADLVCPVSRNDCYFSVGARNGYRSNQYPYRGEMAQLSLWDRALTAEEINYLRMKPVTGDEPDLLDAWTLSGEAGTVGLVSGEALTFVTGDAGFCNDEVKWHVPGLFILVR